jgi:hypothetical protein
MMPIAEPGARPRDAFVWIPVSVWSVRSTLLTLTTDSLSLLGVPTVRHVGWLHESRGFGTAARSGMDLVFAS